MTCSTIKSCSNSYYEQHPNYEIGFVEYSERGNDFDPARTQQLLDRLKQYSAIGKLAMVVFIHGWKHNAEQDDPNVTSFTQALANLSESGVLGDRKLVGIYVGWRGNYTLFHTARIKDPDPKQASAYPPALDSATVVNKAMATPKVLEDTKFGDWELVSYCTPDGSNGDPNVPRMPCYRNEPVNFIYTADSFIDNHNDIFNPAVIAFMSTAVSKAIYERTNGESRFDQCLDESKHQFSFSLCYNHHFTAAEKAEKELKKQNKG